MRWMLNGRDLEGNIYGLIVVKFRDVNAGT
jgi:hypothetical protein